jgi:hypothetical protein
LPSITKYINGGKTMETKFKVAMDKEQAALKNHYEVVLNVDMSTSTREDLEKYAMKAYTVELQSQIRPNWDTFISQCEGKVFTKGIVFGCALFESTRGKVTQEKAQEAYKNKVGAMSMLKKLQTLLADEMITMEIYEASIEKLHDEGKITDEEYEVAYDI